jgi:hypothetical protein
MNNIKEKNTLKKNEEEQILNIPKEYKMQKEQKKINRKIKINKTVKKLDLKLIFD